jgi:hypothetical protein
MFHALPRPELAAKRREAQADPRYSGRMRLDEGPWENFESLVVARQPYEEGVHIDGISSRRFHPAPSSRKRTPSRRFGGSSSEAPTSPRDIARLAAGCPSFSPALLKSESEGSA